MSESVESIMSSGRYSDRRGREWWRGPSMYWHEKATWKNIKRTLTGRLHDLTPDQMRLLIVRDQHRDECRGLLHCASHPVPVVLAGPSYDRTWSAYAAHGGNGKEHPTLAEAFAAAENMMKEKNNG